MSILSRCSFLIAFRPSHDIFIAPSEMLNFRLTYSTIYTTQNIPDSSLLYEYWSLTCPREVQVADIWCLAHSYPSIISATVTQFSL